MAADDTERAALLRGVACVVRRAVVVVAALDAPEVVAERGLRALDLFAGAVRVRLADWETALVTSEEAHRETSDHYEFSRAHRPVRRSAQLGLRYLGNGFLRPAYASRLEARALPAANVFLERRPPPGDERAQLLPPPDLRCAAGEADRSVARPAHDPREERQLPRAGRRRDRAGRPPVAQHPFAGRRDPRPVDAPLRRLLLAPGLLGVGDRAAQRALRTVIARRASDPAPSRGWRQPKARPRQ